jgi:hypothetical protein
MLTFSKLSSSVIEGGKRILKVMQYGAKTAKESGPFGFDSSAPEGWTAIYGETSNMGESVILGYINKNQLAEVGGSRMYALDGNGDVVGFVYARASGNLELNGNAFSAVRFQNLKTAIDNNDSLINAELAKIATAIGTLGGAYVVAPISTNLANTESATVRLK